MEQLDFFSIPSPCIGVCQVNERGYCKGCMRSRDERFNWQKMTADQQRNTIRLCRQRYLRVMRRNKAHQEKPLPEQELSSQQSLFDDQDV
ncbi:DUF1289 domain-containing protein [Photobacterium chitinilyticum]|uniref:DUF1289 domain-containing protein n=1 Tax=Photobacterium chitinilyticum TaxID=2485123 RepID=A0A444JWN3_9GAMM|nr:DUF1289 domain-containing protein [Photobacterium chitinilyticum]RWX57479.1 DUF1289 domain-containing protein [Photobacterium chitinilyticum]